jgi:hypothetical protein
MAGQIAPPGAAATSIGMEFAFRRVITAPDFPVSAVEFLKRKKTYFLDDC